MENDYTSLIADLDHAIHEVESCDIHDSDLEDLRDEAIERLREIQRLARQRA